MSIVSGCHKTRVYINFLHETLSYQFGNRKRFGKAKEWLIHQLLVWSRLIQDRTILKCVERTRGWNIKYIFRYEKLSTPDQKLDEKNVQCSVGQYWVDFGPTDCCGCKLDALPQDKNTIKTSKVTFELLPLQLFSLPTQEDKMHTN